MWTFTNISLSSITCRNIDEDRFSVSRESFQRLESPTACLRSTYRLCRLQFHSHLHQAGLEILSPSLERNKEFQRAIKTPFLIYRRDTQYQENMQYVITLLNTGIMIRFARMNKYCSAQFLKATHLFTLSVMLSLPRHHGAVTSYSCAPTYIAIPVACNIYIYIYFQILYSHCI